jgi:hypothetical protein
MLLDLRDLRLGRERGLLGKRQAKWRCGWETILWCLKLSLLLSCHLRKRVDCARASSE